MTENTPDAVKVAREALANEYDKTGWHDQAARIRDVRQLETDPLKFAILGARAMQAAMPAPAGVRVKALEDAMREACDLLAERTHGSPARSPAHNARLRLEAALSAIEGAGAREGAYDPERDLEPCLEARLFVTPESLDAFMEANPLPPEPTPPPTPAGAGDLVERLRGKVFAAEGQRLRLVAEEAASRIEALQAEVERLRWALKPFADDKMPSSKPSEIAHNEWGLRCLMSPLEIARSKARAALSPAKAGG